jgi:hypothetical protein
LCDDPDKDTDMSNDTPTAAAPANVPDSTALTLAALDAQEAFRSLPIPTNLAEAQQSFSAAVKWHVAVMAFGDKTPARAKAEAHAAQMAATEILKKFEEAAYRERVSGYDLDDLKALDGSVVEILLDAPPNTLFLHNDYLPAPLAAARMFAHFAKTGEMYRRGSAIVEISKSHGMEVLSPTGFRSRLNKRGRKVLAIKKTQTDPPEVFASGKHCGEDQAKVLLGSTEVNLLPEIKLVAAKPLLVELAGELVTTTPGYNPECGVLVTGKGAVRDIPIAEAAAALAGLLRDFNFTGEGDRSRGLAGLVAPAIRMGCLLPGTDALIDAVEADDSQAGKGWRHKLTHAIYGEVTYGVAKRDGGVGSFDESLSAALMSGKPFITLDNLRGELNSTLLEATVTPISSDGRVAVRLPHRGEVMVDASRTLIQITSNGFSSTRDLANRLLIQRLLKQPPDYQYATWEGGNLLAHAALFSDYYLSCVHSVIRYWHANGKRKLPTPHTFKDWVGTLDWIVQSVWAAQPLLTGHAEATGRLANKSLTWLRMLAVAVVREGKAGALSGLKAGELREICERAGILPEGVKPGHEDNQAERAIGVVMAACFRDTDSVVLDGICVTRSQREEYRADHRDHKATKFYTFTRVN